jgi:rhamnosyltransferase
MYEPNTSLLVDNKIVPVQRGISTSSLPRIAIHLHTFYLDVFEQYIAYFDNYSINFDLFITTDAPDKKKYIENYMKEHASRSKIKEIIITENRGRDIFPWLCIGNRLNTYDVVGHFHAKHTETAEEIIGITWQQELFDLLINPIDTIIETFCANKNTGIIIPDIPYIFSKVEPLKFSQEKDMQIIMNNLWKRMCCKKQIDFTKLLTAIMPCGTMFWYRPQALASLFQLSLSPDDIPAEPLPTTKTILHCIERMLVYIAWSEGYDYRIMVAETPQTSLFTDNMLLNKELQSKTYRMGEFILAGPKKIRDIFLKSR